MYVFDPGLWVYVCYVQGTGTRVRPKTNPLNQGIREQGNLEPQEPGTPGTWDPRNLGTREPRTGDSDTTISPTVADGVADGLAVHWYAKVYTSEKDRHPN
jgi:hypothetical protein